MEGADCSAEVEAGRLGSPHEEGWSRSSLEKLTRHVDRQRCAKALTSESHMLESSGLVSSVVCIVRFIFSCTK